MILVRDVLTLVAGRPARDAAVIRGGAVAEGTGTAKNRDPRRPAFALQTQRAVSRSRNPPKTLDFITIHRQIPSEKRFPCPDYSSIVNRFRTE